MRPGSAERREPAQVRLENIHLAEDAGLLVGYPGRVKLLGVLWGEKVPTFPSDRSEGRQLLQDFFCFFFPQNRESFKNLTSKNQA